MKGHQGWVGVMLLCAGAVQAEVRVEVPGDFQILAVSDGKVQDERHGVLADGAQQLLVRYEGVIPSRNSSDNDRQIRSEPQVIRYEASGQSVRLQAAVPTDEKGMERYAKAPVVSLLAGDKPLKVQQEALVVNGMQIGMDWHARLMEYNRGTGKAVLATGAVATTAAVQAPSVPASELEGQLQQLFLRADPELRKRFIGWAVPRL
ncbi:DUF2057 domain-containing protein [Aeromonas media]|uniref:DUF2057 domain-containing protein n=1 Tax=Aeromonas media TaxID=651 RepID=A0A7Z3HA30_AERME|nr:DUF2057 domain-containing protein [Aeromonas media]MBP8112349.1 DUF2057 domain-containing protein [Aeromonas sp.]AHX62460.1 hypothetical protein B224_4430 [Aeromonas media WS]MBP8152106.1 DUF2057 domain-containing protein [Aeromonas sp.]MBP8159201.1 DUF2057 domain-containing protein [Aeromonas sp.]MBS4639390.1 DUF2057 domain-containing protein [Aeromonas media]